jgi:hypothetical protein
MKSIFGIDINLDGKKDFMDELLFMNLLEEGDGIQQDEDTYINDEQDSDDG